MENQKIQKVNSELRTIAAEELQRAIASELESIENDEISLKKLLLGAEIEKDKGESEADDTE